MRYRMTPEWRRRRDRLYEERGGICEICGEPLERKPGRWACHSKSGLYFDQPDDNFVICCTECDMDFYQEQLRRSMDRGPGRGAT